MVSRDHEHVRLLHRREEAAEPCIELHDGACISSRITAMAEDHIEVDEIDKGETREVLAEERSRLFHAVGIVLVRAKALCEPFPCKDVGDLADADGGESRILQGVEHGRRRLKREVVPACRALVIRILADEGTRDDPADAVLALHNGTRLAARLVKLLTRHDALVRRELQHAVRRGVDDERTRLDVLAPVVMNDLRARIRLVAYQLPADARLKRGDDLGREALGIRRHRVLADDARQLPMPRRRVLAARAFAQPCKSAARRRHAKRGCLRRVLDAVDREEPKRGEMRRRKAFRTHETQERVARAVAEVGGIGCGADAEAVEHDEEYALDLFQSSSPLSLRAKYSRSRMPRITRFS